MKEFTVILYAGGSNRLSSDLSLPKALLPIGNRPLIWYALQLIQCQPALASSPLLILISSHHRQSIEDYLSTVNIPHELIVQHAHHESTTDEVQPIQDELGTLDVLRLCYSRIRTESVCLLACDLFGRVNLTSMINMFRVRDASLCMLLLKTVTTPTSTGKDSLIQPGQKTKFRPEVEFFTLDQSTSTVTSVKFEADLDGYLPLKPKILAKFPQTIIRTDLIDSHLYLIKKSSLDIAFRSTWSSFRKEFLPKMIRQLAIGESLDNLIPLSSRQKIVRQKTMDFDDQHNLSSILNKYDCDETKISRGCYYVIHEIQPFRVKHILAYLEANRQASALIASYTNEDVTYQDRIEQVQISSDCVIGEGCDIGRKSTVKRTIIGRHCRIDEKCKLTNCILLDHVTIKEGVTIQNSILCSRSFINTKCEIHNSIVCQSQQVEANSKLNGETISAENDEINTFMLDEENEE